MATTLESEKRRYPRSTHHQVTREQRKAKERRPKLADYPEIRLHVVQPQLRPSHINQRKHDRDAWTGAVAMPPHPRSMTEETSHVCASTKKTRTRAMPGDWTGEPPKSTTPRWTAHPDSMTRRCSAEIRR
ncbi:hypothetical protein PF003_g35237 [Phytophthora fragariae]|nr:hypothetical protein PF003_g35237 [Phytophthora fragariae]